jgi:3-hydroxyisobutyrate dehydrogenase
MNILWIGTGVMGKSMAGHLLDAGHQVQVSTRTRGKAEALLERGATWVDQPAEAAPSADVICAMVGFPSDVEAVMLGAAGVVGAAKPGALLIDFTTSSPGLAVRIAAEAEKVGIDSLDAPVSGGDVGAKNAALSIMVGGPREAFDRALSILETVGKTIVYQGGAGSGQHTKMANQILIASNMIGICEGMLYAQKAGLDPDTVLKSVTTGAAGSWSLQNLAPRFLKGDLEPGFFVEHFVKDMAIALEESKRMGLQMPGLTLAHELYTRLVDEGYGRKGTQALIRALEAMAG